MSALMKTILTVTATLLITCVVFTVVVLMQRKGDTKRILQNYGEEYMRMLKKFR